jgi:putative FmdB family regulatory protein
MPTYDFKCDEHGYEEIICSVGRRKEQKCSTCGGPVRQVLLSAPRLDQTAMAYAGMPGAIEKQGNYMEKRHRKADQAHRPAQRG